MTKIDNIDMNGRLVLAPLAGYTDSPFRRIAKKNGSSLVFTELISAEGIIRGNKKTMKLLKFTEEERPIGIQIFGNNAEIIGEAANIVEELKPNFIDINLGCCAPKVCKNGSGAALLKNPAKLESIVKKVVNSVKIPVSAKIRIGWDDENKNYLEIIKILEGSGVSLISVHGRTRAQRYRDKADWDIINEISNKSSIPIIGNGDIKSFSEAMTRLRTSGCIAVMIGREAVGNPWIFSGHTPTIKVIIDQIKEHLEMMIDFYGERGLILMRKHTAKYIHGLKNAAKIRSFLVNSTSKNEIFSFLESIKKDYNPDVAIHF